MNSFDAQWSSGLQSVSRNDKWSRDFERGSFKKKKCNKSYEDVAFDRFGHGLCPIFLGGRPRNKPQYLMVTVGRLKRPLASTGLGITAITSHHGLRQTSHSNLHKSL